VPHQYNGNHKEMRYNHLWPYPCDRWWACSVINIIFPEQRTKQS